MRQQRLAVVLAVCSLAVLPFVDTQPLNLPNGRYSAVGHALLPQPPTLRNYYGKSFPPVGNGEQAHRRRRRRRRRGKRSSPSNEEVHENAVRGSNLMVRADDDVISEDLLAAVDEERVSFNNLHQAQFTTTPTPYTYTKSGKRAHFWHALEDTCHIPHWFDNKIHYPGCKPRKALSATERAIEILHKRMFIRKDGAPHLINGQRIVGAKFWFQLSKGGLDHMGDPDEHFNHYIRDETYALDEQKMKFATAASILHLTDFGAPTIILNQTVIQNGNVEFPYEPTSLWVVYPRRGRHVMFRGDLSLGTSNIMTATQVPVADERRVLVISWWTEKPLAPHCHHLQESYWNHFKIYDETTRWTGRPSNKSEEFPLWTAPNERMRPVEPAIISVPGVAAYPVFSELLETIEFDLGRPGKAMTMRVPLRSLEQSLFSRVDFVPIGFISTQTLRLDLENADLMSSVWKSDSLVAMVFTPPVGEAGRNATQQRLKMMLGRSNTAIHPSRIDRLMMIDFEADQMVRSAASHWWWANAMIFSDIFFLPQRILPLCGPAEISQDAMKAFGLSARGMQEPEAVIHNVKTDRKFIAGPKYKPLTAVRERPKPARAHACQAALALTRTLSASVPAPTVLQASLYQFWYDAILGLAPEYIAPEGEEEEE